MPKPDELYKAEFYQRQAEDSLHSARAFLASFFALTKPKSIVDIGCGAGTWLRAAVDMGVADVIGVDGHDLPASSMLIDASAYKKVDLSKDLPVLGRRFDLAMSLEVAEHLPESRADDFVRVLADASDVVLFSAAIPGQGGRHHVNEQFPSYWIKKFSAHGFRCFDALRPALWHQRDLDVWYRQNVVVFARHVEFPGALPTPEAFDRVHPEVWADPKLVQRRLRRNLRNGFRRMLGQAT